LVRYKHHEKEAEQTCQNTCVPNQVWYEKEHIFAGARLGHFAREALIYDVTLGATVLHAVQGMNQSLPGWWMECGDSPVSRRFALVCVS